MLQRSSSSRLAGHAGGTLATIALDSSSVAIILVVSIVDAGLVGFINALPVILGSNIGTNASSQIFGRALGRWTCWEGRLQTHDACHQDG